MRVRWRVRSACNAGRTRSCLLLPQVAFDWRKPDEVRAVCINNVRALMEL